MIEKQIQELCILCKETKQRFRAIRLNGIDLENDMEHVVFEGIKDYLYGLLKIIPKDVDIRYGDRLSIHLWKDAAYCKEAASTEWEDVVIIGDTQAYKTCMTFDECFHGAEFVGFDEKADYIRLQTIEYMCANWHDIKSEICSQIALQLDDYILRQLVRIQEKREKLQNFKDWRL